MNHSYWKIEMVSINGHSYTVEEKDNIKYLVGEGDKNFVVKGNSFGGKKIELMCSSEDKLPFVERVRIGLINKKERIKIPHRIKPIVDDQKNQVKVINEAVAVLKKQKCVQLALETGYGKSAVSLYLATMIGRKTLVIVASDGVKKSFLGFISKFIDCPVQEINSKSGPITADLCVTTIQYLNNADMSKLQHFGTVIVDENVTFCTQIRVNILLQLDPEYMIGLCADTIKDNGLHKALYHFFGDRNSFVVAKIQKDLTVLCLHSRFTATVARQYNGKIDFNKLVGSISANEERNKVVADLVKMFYYHKMMVVCKRKDQAQSIFDKCEKMGLNASLYIGTVKTAETTQVMVTTLSKIERGFDAANACKDYDGRPIEMVLYAGSVKKPQQSIGRAFRSETPLALYIVDDNSILRTHWKNCETYFLKNNAKIIHEYI